MKVQHTALDAYARASTQNAQAAKKPQADAGSSSATPAGSTESANVTISPEARALAEAAGADSQAVDGAKVANLKAQIAAGTFKVDAQTVASRMLDRNG